MAELNADWVACRCGQRYDRNVFTQCTTDGCLADLWNLAGPDRPLNATPATSLEPQGPTQTRIGILINGQRFSLETGQRLRLGRGDDVETDGALCGFDNVSREHAELRNDAGKLFVIDRKPSSNGTFVDDVRLEPNQEYEIRPPQRLRLGSNPPVPIEIVWPQG